MKILFKQFLGQNHSWSCVGWGLAKSFKLLGHEVHLFPTDGIKHLPPDLKENLIGYTELNKPEIVHGKSPDNDYSTQISYTAMKNFQQYMKHSKNNRFGIWAYEWIDKGILPDGFAKNHMYCDALLAPSTWSKQGFINSGIPENKVKVIPHGVDSNQYAGSSKIDLGTNKSFKVLANIAQLHRRKNIPGLLDAWGKAFTQKDDVCLILKTKFKEPEQPFDVSLKDCLRTFNNKYPQHAEVKIYQEFLHDISSLYRSIDAVFTTSFCEAFYFPGLEGAASGKLNISPNFGGQLDFLDSSNSLLINGKLALSDPKSMYWGSKSNATWFVPSIEDTVDKLRYAYINFKTMNETIEKNRQKVLEKYSWATIANSIISICQ